jgi:hypothetical protein
MKNTLKKLALFMIILAVFSCSKSDDGGTEPEPIQNVRLKTYSVNTNEYDITYSTEGKPTGFETSSGNNVIVYNANSQITQIGSRTYTYNSQGRIATVNRGNIASTIIYNNVGQVAVINSTYTISGTARTSTSTMEYEGSKLKTIKEYNTYSAPNYNKLILEYDTNNNIIQKIVTYSLDDITYTIEETNNYTYDTKTNPMYHTLTKTGITSQISMFYFIGYNDLGNSGYESLKYYNKNNMLSSQRIGSTGTIYESNNYEYVYDENNFPISAELQFSYSTGGNGTIYYNWIYETVD